MRAIPLVLASLLLGCTPGEVTVTGTVLESRHEDAGVLASGEVTIRDQIGEIYSSTTTREDGSFRTRAPAGQTIFAEVSRGEDVVPTVFRGVSGLETTLTLSRGDVWGYGAEELEELEERYEGCPGVGEGGGVIVGEVRLYLPTDQDTPLIANAQVFAVREAEEGGDEERSPACYVDADGNYQDRYVQTGPTGTFVIFGLEEGGYTLLVSYEPIPDTTDEAYSVAWVTEGGVTPYFPTWVELVH